MDQKEILTKLKEGERFLLEERVALPEFKQLLTSIGKHFLPDDQANKTLELFPSSHFPAIFSQKITIDFLEFDPPIHGQPVSLSIIVSWDDEGISLIEDVLELEACSVGISVTGTHLQATLAGVFKLADYEIQIQTELPSLLTKVQLVGGQPQDENRDAMSVLRHFGADLERPRPGASSPKLAHLLMVASPIDRQLLLNVAIEHLSVGRFEMDLEVELQYLQSQMTGSLFTSFEIELKPDKPGQKPRAISVLLNGAYNGPGTGVQLEGGVALSGINLVDLAGALKDKFNISDGPKLPEALGNVSAEVKFVYLSFNTESKAFTFSCSLRFHEVFDVNDSASSENIELNLDFHFSPCGEKDKEGHELTFSGQLLCHLATDAEDKADPTSQALEFDIVFDKKPESQTLVAAYKDVGGGALNIGQLIALFSSDDVSDLGFKIDLEQAYFVSTKDSQGDGQHKFMLGLDIGGGIDLSGLPLVGQLLPDSDRLSVNLQPFYASGPFEASDLADAQELVPGDSLALPDKKIGKGADITISLNLGGEPIKFDMPISLGDVNTDKQADEQKKPGENKSPSPDAENESDDGTHWFKLQKSFGPVSFQRLGVKYEDQQFWFKLDGALTAAGLTLSLDGLGVGVELPHVKAPEFELHGLGLDFKKGGFEIGGSFLRVPGEPGKREDEYDGMAVMKYGQLGLSAIGSYSMIEGHPSLFLYAVLDYPIGGPAFFFVTGLAAGFGYNRSLVMPQIEEVETFPLVALASPAGQPAPATTHDARKESLTRVINDLHDAIPPTSGQYFIAAGVKFNSFKLIDSFVLLSVSFGVHFEIDLLGLSTLTAPAPGGSDAKVKPLAVAKLALRGAFIPDEGFLGVEARLTSESFIFDPACHLTGGFAFYSWFDGEHEGDFVLTLGGYHPKFKVPDHYPQVPRLGVNWRVSSEFSVKADFYFALTANALMAGGHLNATYHSGDIKAWFQAGADFIISWKPYFYDASFSVGMGVDVAIHFFGTHHLTFHLGADVHVWGPEFSGRARIHLYVVTFTVSFGSGQRVNPFITFDEFQDSFVPEPAKVCSATVTRGKLREIDTAAGKHFLINGKELQVTVNTTIPASEAQLGLSKFDEAVTIAKPGMRPVKGANSSNFQSQLEIKVIRIENEKEDDFTEDFRFEPILKKVPAAVWGQPATEAHALQGPPKPDLNGERFVEHALSGFRLSPKKPPDDGESHRIDRSKLGFSTHRIEDGFSFETERRFEVSDVDDELAFINNHILDQKVVEKRNRLLIALGIQLDTFDLDIDRSIASAFVEKPMVGDYT